MKYWPVGSYIFTKSTPRFPGEIQLLAIGYKYSSRKVLGFIATEGAESTEPSDPYLSRFPDFDYNVYVHPIVFPHLLGRYFNTCNEIYNHNRIQHSDIALEKYWVTQSSYFRLATTVEWYMVITDRKILYCHGVAEGNMDKKISTLEYKNRTVYECFNNPFTAYFGSPALNLPPITIDDTPPPHKRAQYTPDLLPDEIYVVSEKYFSTLTTPSNFPDLLPSDNTNTLHVMKKYVTFKGRVNREYCCRKHSQTRCYKKTRLYWSTCSDKKRKFNYCHGFSMISSETSTCFLEHQHYMP